MSSLEMPQSDSIDGLDEIEANECSTGFLTTSCDSTDSSTLIAFSNEKHRKTAAVVHLEGTYRPLWKVHGNLPLRELRVSPLLWLHPQMFLCPWEPSTVLASVCGT